MQYGDEIALLREGLSLRRVRSRTGRAINTLRKLRTLFVIWKTDRALTPSPIIPKQPQSPHSRIPPIPSHRWPQFPSLHTRCNLSSPDATCRKPSTLESLSAFFGVMQPDNRKSPTPFSKIRETFRTGVVHWKTSRTMCDELGTDRIRGTTGEPTIYSWKLKHHNCIGCRIFSYLCREFFEDIAGQNMG